MPSGRVSAMAAAGLLLAVSATVHAQPTLQWGGRLQIDHDRFDGVYTERGDRRSATYLRRADLELAGRLHRALRYEVEVEADGDGKVTLDTAALVYDGFGAGTVLFGRFDPDFGLEQTISSSWITGIERSAIWDLAPEAAEGSDGIGLHFRSSATRHHASVGAFRKRTFDLLVARGVLAPMAQETRVVHLGLSVADARGAGSNDRIRSRLAVRGVSEVDDGQRFTLSPAAVPGAFGSDRSWAAEFALLRGPWSLQAEWLQRRLGGAASREASGAYLQLAFTLTGEARRYRIERGRFAGIKPARAFGAWEVFGRIDRLKARAAPGAGDARATVQVLGLNWYANEWARLSLNLLRSRVDGRGNDAGDTAGDALGLRAQVVF